jgi:hypothetical protein
MANQTELLRRLECLEREQTQRQATARMIFVCVALLGGCFPFSQWIVTAIWESLR